MATDREQLIALIEQARLKPNELALWHRVLAELADEDVTLILNNISDSPTIIQSVTNMLTEKEAALQKHDLPAWVATQAAERSMLD